MSSLGEAKMCDGKCLEKLRAALTVLDAIATQALIQPLPPRLPGTVFVGWLVTCLPRGWSPEWLWLPYDQPPVAGAKLKHPSDGVDWIVLGATTMSTTKASRALRRFNACERKKSYATREAAVQKGQEVYQCGYCRQWHRSGAVAALVAKVRGRK